MKEVKTKDGVVLYYIKNPSKSINGVCNVFDIYDRDKKPLGLRIGSRDLKSVTYESLFNEEGGLIYDPHGKLKDRTNGKTTKKSVGTVQKTEPVITKTLPPGILSVTKLKGIGFETSIKFRVTLRTARKITVEDILTYLGKKYEVWGYDILAQTKKIEVRDEGGDENGKQDDSTNERTPIKSTSTE